MKSHQITHLSLSFYLARWTIITQKETFSCVSSNVLTQVGFWGDMIKAFKWRALKASSDIFLDGWKVVCNVKCHNPYWLEIDDTLRMSSYRIYYCMSHLLVLITELPNQICKPSSTNHCNWRGTGNKGIPRSI